MRVELTIILVAGFIMANIYTDGKYARMLLGWKKYYQMIGVAIGAYFVYFVFKKNPLRAKELITNSNEYIKYLPIDKNTSNMISPLLDFTSKQSFGNIVDEQPYLPMNDYHHKGHPGVNRMMTSGKNKTKRSVSETKKKFVAARQDWCCNDCKNQLSAWFEVDHVVRLENGGDNHIDNLVALCRECHGKKTALENL